MNISVSFQELVHSWSLTIDERVRWILSTELFCLCLSLNGCTFEQLDDVPRRSLRAADWLTECLLALIMTCSADPFKLNPLVCLVVNEI